jgi:hypothetical protein
MKNIGIIVLCAIVIFTACAGQSKKREENVPEQDNHAYSIDQPEGQEQNIKIEEISLPPQNQLQAKEKNVVIQDITTNSKGQIEIRVKSSPEYYYVLYGSEHNNDDFPKPLSVTLGQPGNTILTESLHAYPKENYVVKQFSVDNPGDLDKDSIDDVTEMRDLGRLGPLNPAKPIDIRNGSVSIKDRAMFEQLSYKGPDVAIDGHLRDLEFVKFYILDVNTDNPQIYFMNSVNHRAHGTFANAIGIAGGFGGRGGSRGGRGGGGYPGGVPGVVPGGAPGGVPGGGSNGQMRGEIVYHPYATAPNGLPGVYRFEFEPNDYYSFEDVKMAYELFAKNMPFLENNWTYYPMPRSLPLYNQEKSLYDNSRVAILLEGDIYAETNFLPLNVAEGFGLLRLMGLDELPNSRDIVIYESLPNELPRVGGIITTVPQTPLSHTNLRAVQDNLPNAYIRSATKISPISDLIGKYVYLKVTNDGYEIREATTAEVETYFMNIRPTEEQFPVSDLFIKEIKPLDDISFDESTAFGVKATNVAAMRSFGLPQGVIPDGYAIPFYFYDEFMKYNGFYDKAQRLLEDPGFLDDYSKQEAELDVFREEIKNGEVPEWMEEAFVQLQKSFPEDTPLRCRSSTNNEDLPGFSGAGLYDSKTHRTEEGSISKTILELYASLWNFRAFDERQFYRIDHLSAAMGVLVHPNYSDELVNGVAVATDPLYQTRNAYYINSQLGEDLVTNPNSLSVPEEILLDVNKTGSNSYTIVRFSNLVDGNKLLMTVDQLDELRGYITTINEKFRELYKIPSYNDFAIEIEYKVTSENKIAIKQARPWILR